MGTMNIYRNVEKRGFSYTFGTDSATADRTDQIEVQIPDGWQKEILYGKLLLISPWGRDYMPGEVLRGSLYPYLSAVDRGGVTRNYRLWEV